MSGHKQPPSVQVFLKEPKAESAPQGIWKVDVYIMRQLNAIIALGYAEDTAFREPNGE